LDIYFLKKVHHVSLYRKIVFLSSFLSATISLPKGMELSTWENPPEDIKNNKSVEEFLRNNEAFEN
jgi:hypothetical protein